MNSDCSNKIVCHSNSAIICNSKILFLYSILIGNEMISLQRSTLAYCFFLVLLLGDSASDIARRIGGCWIMDGPHGRGIKRGTALMSANQSMKRNAWLDYSKSHKSLPL